MRKTFKMQDLECANCAAKMENAISKLDGVTDAKVSFMTQKLTLEAADDKFNELLAEAVRICKSFEPDVEVLGA